MPHSHAPLGGLSGSAAPALFGGGDGSALTSFGRLGISGSAALALFGSSDGSALGVAQAQRARVLAVSAARSGETDATLLVAKVRQSEPPIVRVFTSTAATDLRNVAREQYGHAAQWTVIGKASGVTTPRPTPGTTILVPASPQ